MAGTNPRAARIAALIQRVIASSMEAQLHDKRLANVSGNYVLFRTADVPLCDS